MSIEDPLAMERLADALPIERAASRWIVSTQIATPSALGSGARCSRSISASGMCTPGTRLRSHCAERAEASGPTPTMMWQRRCRPSARTLRM